MVHVKEFYGGDDHVDTEVLAFLNSIPPHQTVVVVPSSAGKFLVIARENTSDCQATATIDAAILLAQQTTENATLLAANANGGQILVDAEFLRQQVFEAEGGGGHILDYSTPDAPVLHPKFTYGRLTSSVPMTFIQWVNNVQVDRLHLLAGEVLTFPVNEQESRLTSHLFSFPHGQMPVGTHVIFEVSDGPCSLKLFWLNGPEQF